MRPKLKIKRCEAPGVVMELMQKTTGKQKKKFTAIYLAMSGRFTTDEIADKVGCSRASVTNWVRVYREGGVLELFRTNYKPTREPALSKEVLDNLIHHMSFSIVPNRIGHMQRWLYIHYGIEITRPAVRYWWNKIWEMVNRGYKFPKNPPEVILPAIDDDRWYDEGFEWPKRSVA